MSGYNGRRAPNFSQYLEDLNAIPSPYDQALQQQQDSFNLDAELALFTNAEFLDFDSFDNGGGFGDMNVPPLKYEDQHQQQQQQQDHHGAAGAEDKEFKYLDLLNADFSNLPDYSSADFNPSDPQMLHMQGSAFTPVPQVPSGPISNNGTSSPTGQSTRSTPITSQAPAGPAPARTAAPTPAPVAGTKRKRPPQHDGPLTPEEAARLAAEEDKRRRNTAASARFRIKKKLREQALERTVKETTEKNAALEARVSQLELENQWLKNLITEKNGGTSSEADEEIAQLFKKFLATQQKAESERNASQSKQGVGTSA